MRSPDWTVVGAGLYGATFARSWVERHDDARVLVLEQERRVGGHAASEQRHGIEVHLFGPHIFHTHDSRVWQWANRFARFAPYRHVARVLSNGEEWSFPVNLATGRQVFGVDTPEDFRAAVARDAAPYRVGRAANLEEHALASVGPTLYELLFYGFTKKAWGVEPRELPAAIVKRIPIRWTEDDRYFKGDQHEGIPEGGYTAWIERILDHPRIEVRLGERATPGEVVSARDRRFVWSGTIDGFLDRALGALPYRSRRFEHRMIPNGFAQETPLVNLADPDDPRLRLIEHKHFSLHELDGRERAARLPSVISTEYATVEGEPYYPIRSDENAALYRRYRSLAAELAPHVMFGGRLGTYRYMNMDQVIASAQHDVRTLDGIRAR